MVSKFAFLNSRSEVSSQRLVLASGMTSVGQQHILPFQYHLNSGLHPNLFYPQASRRLLYSGLAEYANNWATTTESPCSLSAGYDARGIPSTTGRVSLMSPNARIAGNAIVKVNMTASGPRAMKVVAIQPPMCISRITSETAIARAMRMARVSASKTMVIGRRMVTVGFNAKRNAENEPAIAKSDVTTTMEPIPNRSWPMHRSNEANNSIVVKETKVPKTVINKNKSINWKYTIEHVIESLYHKSAESSKHNNSTMLSLGSLTLMNRIINKFGKISE